MNFEASPATLPAVELLPLVPALVHPDLDELEAWLRARPAELAKHVRFHESDYCRVTLARSESAELLVLGWMPGQTTRIHGHGRSVGVVLVLSGTLEEACYKAHGGGRLSVESALARPGDALRETPGRVHRVFNPTSEPAISLHVYSPPLDPR